jgi:hypothetical protein
MSETLTTVLIQRLQVQRTKDGDALEPEPNTPVEVIQKRLALELSLTVSLAALAVLCYVDGFEYGGLFWYAADTRPLVGRPDAGDVPGIVEDNLEYWSVCDRGWLVLGYEEAFAYAVDTKSAQYFRFIRDNKTLERSYSCFDEMLADALDWALVPVRDVVPETFKLSR